MIFPGIFIGSGHDIFGHNIIIEGNFKHSMFRGMVRIYAVNNDRQIEHHYYHTKVIHW